MGTIYIVQHVAGLSVRPTPPNAMVVRVAVFRRYLYPGGRRARTVGIATTR